MKQVWEPAQLEEMPVVILSLHQKWWQKMAAGESFWTWKNGSEKKNQRQQKKN